MQVKTQNIELKRLGYLSIRYSLIDKGNWAETKSYLIGLLRRYGLDVYLIIRMFGRDEVWAVFSYTNLETVEKVEEEPSVIYTAILAWALPFNEEVMADVVRKRLPVAYLLFRKRQISLEDVKTTVEATGGRHFLIGEMNHPQGYSHVVLLTAKTGQISDLNDVVYDFTKRIRCKDWECLLGTKHGWTKTSKSETGSFIGDIIKDWIEAAEKGELADLERKEIFERFGLMLPEPEKQK